MQTNKDPYKLGDLLKSRVLKKTPAYEWQELALKIIKDLNIPNFKKSSVFKICKEKPEYLIKQSLIDTKELCQTNEKWRYFFKIVNKQ